MNGTDVRKTEPAGDLPRRVDRWVDAGVISREQAEAILAMEGPEAPPERGVPLVTEALGYLGAALALAAGAVALGRYWEELPTGTLLGISGAGAALLWLGGWLVRSARDPAIERLGSVLWALSVAGVGWFLQILADQGFDLTPNQTWLTVGAGTSVYGGVLYVVRRRSLQQVVLFAGLVTLAGNLGWQIGRALDVPGGSEHGLATALWLLGIAWVLLAWRGVVRPPNTAYALGAVVSLYAPILWGPEALFDLAVIVGLVTAAALLGASVAVHRTVLLGLGAVGVFGYLVGVIERYFGDTLGTPLVLLVAGVALLGTAVLTARLRPLTRGPGAAR